ncbi:hypothetical protein TNCV_3654001 [Trichonephila clavipes]|nr:hypothetical protein TNCV_3654001 [Trichonephila clavipes]
MVRICLVHLTGKKFDRPIGPAWSKESRFRLLSANGRLRIGCQAYETMDPVCQGEKGHHTAPTNLAELWTASANIWQVIPVERSQNFVESMTRAAVIKARSCQTRY